MTASVNNKSSYAFAQTMQRLWMDHAIWARQYIIAAVDDRPELTEALARWLRNAADVGAALEEFYPRRPARRVAKLLKQHITVAVDLVDAAKNVDGAKFTAIDQVWTSNSDDLVDELCARDQSCSRDEVAARWDLARALTEQVLTARLEQHFDHDVESFDQLLTTCAAMGDLITDGILRQFADRFAA